MRQVKLATSLLAVAALAVGCSDRTEERAKEAAHATGAAVESAAEDTAQNAERAKDAIDAAAHEAKTSPSAEKARDAANDAGATARAAIETAKVKAALIADSRVDAAGIDVDTDGHAKTVTLKGHVPSKQQRAAATQIAQAKAIGYTVHNELEVRNP
jgi:osmotically-inducible protein OsmY